MEDVQAWIQEPQPGKSHCFLAGTREALGKLSREQTLE